MAKTNSIMLRTFLTLCLAFAASMAFAAEGENKEKEPKETDFNLLRAAIKGWHVRLAAGFNIGGTSPLPLPREIPVPYKHLTLPTIYPH